MLPPQEKQLAKRLYYYNHTIHYILIGDKYEDGLYSNYHALVEELRIAKMDLLDRKIIFYVVLAVLAPFLCFLQLFTN